MKLQIKKLVFFCLFLALACQAKTIYVDDDGPADFNNIQSAIDDSNDGDTIIVYDGTYRGNGNRDIDFKGKAITLRSQNGPENCVIDCNGTHSSSHSGFYLHSGEGPDSIISGLTIKNGYLYALYAYIQHGAGIYCSDSSPTIENCVITDNVVEAWGGPGADAYGGGIYCGHNSSPTIVNCTISDNKATDPGGWSFGLGGGIYCHSTSNPTLISCNINQNSDNREWAGGILNDGGNLTLTKCVFTGNRIGFNNSGGTIMLTQCRFNCNFVTIIIGENGKGRLSNCTLSDNFGGLSADGSEATLTNCILWNNEPWEIYVYKGTVLATYSDVEGGWPGEGNINVDPCFAQPGIYDDNGTPGEPGDDSWTEGDYHLKSQAGRWDANEGRWTIDEVTSLCIDAGDPKSPIGLEPFPNGGVINMGAYGGTEEASKSYFGKPLCETIVAGDINGDCIVNFKDFAMMAFHWLEEK